MIKSVLRKRYLLLAACAVGVLLIAACAPAGAPAPAPNQAPAAQATAPAQAAATGRGSCGTLRLLWWQAPTILNPHLSQGTKDYDASRLVYLPLAAIGPDGTPDASVGLAADVPTKDNGGISADGTTTTWKLKPNLKWSDGQPLTSDDVVFTWQYATDKDTAATDASSYADIKTVEAVDPQTVKITWNQPQPVPYVAFVGVFGMIIPKHIFQ